MKYQIKKLNQIKSQSNSLIFIALLLVTIVYWICWLIQYTHPIIFLFSILLIYFSAIPKYLSSPRNLLVAYYFIFYTIPVIFAQRYQGFTFREPSEVISYLMLIATFIIGYTTLYYAENYNFVVLRKNNKSKMINICNRQKNMSMSRIFMIAGCSTMVSIVSAAMVIKTSSGLSAWIVDPGRAFITRSGSGLYSILLIYSSSIAAISVGYACYKTKKILPILIFLIFILVISPVLGGKARIFMTILFLLLPWIFFTRVNWCRFKFLVTLSTIIAIFLSSYFLGTWFRNRHWITLTDLIPYSLNYFSTYEMLVISVRDVKPSFLSTTLLPFNKFLTPFGQHTNLFYDMSSWLTSIYFPEVWKLRATDQWPIETDIYLSFYYILGIPFLIAFFYIIGTLFRLAVNSGSLGYSFTSFFVSLHMVSHLRGGLILWTDFYLIPFWIVAYFYLRKYKI